MATVADLPLSHPGPKPPIGDNEGKAYLWLPDQRNPTTLFLHEWNGLGWKRLAFAYIIPGLFDGNRP